MEKQNTPQKREFNFQCFAQSHAIASFVAHRQREFDICSTNGQRRAGPTRRPKKNGGLSRRISGNIMD